MEVRTPIRSSLEDEHVIGVDPPLKPDLPRVWRRRMHAFTGRAISDKALTAEQDMRSGLQRLQGLALTAGIVTGLDAMAGRLSIGTAPGQAYIDLAPGLALARSGEDVTVGSARQILLSALPLILPVAVADALGSDGTIAAPPPAAATAVADRFAELAPMTSRLAPPLPRRIAMTLGKAIDKPAADNLPRAAILVAQPIKATVLGRQGDDCPPDPRDDPYADLQRIDGCRLLLYVWPGEMVAKEPGPDYAYPVPGPAWRSQLAWRVFDAEAALQGDEMHPWESWGVPLALVGFNPDWTLAFVDRAAVTRRGGAPCSRSPLVPQVGTPLLWQARIEQLVEHMSALPDLEAPTLRAALGRVPPAGVLPASCFDPIARRQQFFPGGFALSAVPIPQSNLDLAVREAALLAPINLSTSDRVELLVPVPDPLYEPGLLETAQVDGAFAEAITAFTADRSVWLTRREYVRRRYDRLMESVSGQAITWPASASPPSEIVPGPVSEPLNLARIRRVAAGGGTKIHGLTTTATLPINSGDTIWFWVRITDPTGFAGLSLRFAFPGKPSEFAAGVFWGDSTGLPIASDAAPSLAPRRVGELPSAGEWRRIEMPASNEWLAAGGPLGGRFVSGIEFAQRGGTIDYGAFGKTTAQGEETTWLADEAPGPAKFNLGDPTKPATWPWADAADRDFGGLGDFGTTRQDDARLVVAIESLKKEWNQTFLAADREQLSEIGLDGYLDIVDSKIKASNDAIDLGFIRARSDIYRVRQFMLGADSASRLVTSPSLADLAVRDEGARATSEGISKFINAVRLRKAEGIDFETKPAEQQPTTGGSTTPSSTATAPAPLPLGGSGFIARMMTNNVFAIAAPAPPPAPMMLTNLIRTEAPAARMEPAFLAGALMQPQTNLSIQPMALATPMIALAPQVSLATPLAASRIALDTQRYVPKDVRAQRPLPGLIERTISVAERLTPAPAVQALEFAIASKSAVLQTLRQLIAGQKDEHGVARPVGVPLGDLGVPGFKANNGAPSPTLDLLFADQDGEGKNYTDLDTLINQASGKHESDYFTAAVNAIDNAISLMRLVEGRIALYESLADRVRGVRDELLGAAREAAAVLRSIDTEIEEARHDIATAQMLLAEETARVEALNSRRAATLSDHVSFIAYRRVREVNVRIPAPTQEVLSGLAQPPLAACRRDHPEAPDELKRYAALLGEAPVKWFPTIAAEVSKIDQIEAARDALEFSRKLASAAHVLAFESRAVPPAKGSNRFFGSAIRAIQAQQQTLVARRLTKASLIVAGGAGLTLAETHAQLVDTATLGDLAGGKHRNNTLIQLASAEMAGVLEIAACLHDRFAEVTPVIRLAWAEVLSEFDSPAELFSLAGLPRWGEVPRELRRELQGLVDYLFARFDRKSDKATAYFNDLVRTAMLLAAHAPVDQMISARLSTEAPARIGSHLTLNLDTSRARKGMIALIRDSQDRMIAKAVVDDLADGQAGARIIANYLNVSTIVPAMRIELSSAPKFLR